MNTTHLLSHLYLSKGSYIHNHCTPIPLLFTPKIWHNNPIGLCSKPVKRNQKGIECEDCFEWFHTNYIFMSTQSYQSFADNRKLVWMCSRCKFPSFSSSFLVRKTSDFTVTNSFESLSQSSPGSRSSSPDPPLLSSSHLRHISPPRQKKIN